LKRSFQILHNFSRNHIVIWKRVTSTGGVSHVFVPTPKAARTPRALPRRS
jgi:hypothetical protein